MAAERRLLSHRSGDLPPISLISDRMEGEGSGVGGGLRQDLFAVEIMTRRGGDVQAHRERWS